MSAASNGGTEFDMAAARRGMTDGYAECQKYLGRALREIERLDAALDYVEATLTDPGDYLALDVSAMLREVRRARL